LRTVGRGTDGAAGEIGHTCIDPNGDLCRCGRRGCWETVATLGWLRRRAAEHKILRADELDAATLAENARSGSELHRALLEEFADNLALGLANLMQLLTPELIVLNGDVVSGGETLRKEIERRTKQRCLPHIATRVKIAFSELGASAPLLGAAGLVLSEEFRAVS
ncbi:MAG: ROK family protein, partial [Actinobacteria bacterium]|nr:ROK family protein [Actinomycetota bacterium]